MAHLFTHSGPLSLLVLVLLALTRCSNAPSNERPGDERVTPAGEEVWFDEVTERSGLGEFRHRTGAVGEKWMPETYGSGAGFIDYNDDDWQDILLVGGGVWPGSRTADDVEALRLYRNEGDGSFTEVTEKVGLTNVRAYGMGVTVADYDNDGDDDFYFTTLNANRLFRNDGGRFTDVSDMAGVGGGDEWSTCSTFLDANRDGALDLYVCNYVKWSPAADLFCTPDGSTKEYCTPQQYEGVHGRFYVNQGDGTFADRTEETGFSEVPGKSLGAAVLDFNRDGWPDLAVANDTERDLLFENAGDGTFQERGMRSGIAFDDAGNATGGMGIDVGAIDSTGEATIVIGNFAEEAIGVFQHTSHGMFLYRSGTSRLRHPTLMTLAFGLFLFDVDLDGDLDLFVANGHVQPLMAERRDGIGYEQSPQLFVNRGDGTFEEASAAGALARKYVARGAAHADVDRDGDQDILVTENGGPVHLFINRRITAGLYRDDEPSGSFGRRTPKFLRVQLEGGSSNRDGVGARVTVSVDGRSLERYVKTGSSYLSSSEKTVTFGLGQETRVDELVVEWPGGTRNRFTDVPADQHLHVREGADTSSVSSKRKRSITQ